ncbi:tyrosine-type recombinase/integrase [Goodfellowiella coeruleoviolacea]|uniref:Site-specific recombinase XerD n=1 Tax=Goodfellowiella coeruleoviolacea TaxID=334858 RepID=A0AAE3GI48_9PSEU|nr:site-specific integrase [Goodfellowiella coeruleoviolacea]MCP2166573.1 Site-specific recombinase XerD [Goodfellowiella coeruleoviolacea]
MGHVSDEGDDVHAGPAATTSATQPKAAARRTIATESGFESLTEARNRAEDIKSDQRRGRFVDPRAGQTLLGEWVKVWTDAHDVSIGAWAKYDFHLRNHILPKFGHLALNEITRITVKAWVKSLRRTLADVTVADVVTLLSMVLGEAVEEGLIPANPCRKLRITAEGRERPHARPWQVVRIVERCEPTDGLLITTAAYTGMRWGELAGLRWPNVDLARGTVRVDPETGALHEVGGRVELGPPKTPASVRTIHLPEFLVTLLAEHRDRQDHDHVFTGVHGGLLRRSNFRNRVWVPRVNGDPRRGWGPILAGLHFHDLRHTHKTWLIEDGVPEVAQAKRLGHRLGGVRGIYSHVTQVMIDDLLAGLQRRWEQVTMNTTEECSQNTYPDQEPFKIFCSQNAPENDQQPTDGDRRQAV